MPLPVDGGAASAPFPENFVWGAITSPAQSEGDTVSDWAGLAAPDGSVPDDGPRHWRRYRYDFKSLAATGLKAYRFGCDWARLQREPGGRLARDETFRYLEMLAELRSLGVEPWVTLFHNALPRWAAERGGWLADDAPQRFAEFAERLADATDGEVVHWVTLHEPRLYAFSAYVWGAFPGGRRGGFGQAGRALAHMAKGHRLASAALKKRLPGAKVGVAVRGNGYLPARRWHPGDLLAASLAERFLGRLPAGEFLADGACDFAMVDLKPPARLDASALSLATGIAESCAEGNGRTARRKEAGTNDPTRLLAWQRRHRVPVYACGGAAGNEEAMAIELERLFGVCRSMLAGGLDLRGFFYTPLLDQFDHRTGLSAGGGLLKVDFRDPERRRTPRRVAKMLAAAARGKPPSA